MTDSPTRIAIVTGSRAEFGLLRPVIRAVRDHPRLQALVVAAGSHLVSPAETYRDVKGEFPDLIAGAIPMQVAGRTTRADDAESLGVGLARFARLFARLAPAWVAVLGDRIEALAAAGAAAVAGLAVAHIHGGDRAEGIADESIRHAITKLAHLHLAATRQSAERIERMGEAPERIRVVGSPALDDLGAIEPLADGPWRDLGAPDTVLLLHPVGRPPEDERRGAAAALAALHAAERRVLALHPNLDPGRDGILNALADARSTGARVISHLARDRFLALLRRLASDGGVLVGNSSGALIEGAALRLAAVNIGPRQKGRERGSNVVDADETSESIRAALRRALALDRGAITHPFGDGHAGPRIADALASMDPRAFGFTRKLNTY